MSVIAGSEDIAGSVNIAGSQGIAGSEDIAGAQGIAGSQDTVVPPIRLAVDKLAPVANQALNRLDEAARKTSIEADLLDLVRLRASQINGCAYCVDVHSRDALAVGETERRVFAITVWRETPFFTGRQRAALELTEAMTRLVDHPIPDQVIDHAAARFSTRELAELIWVITVINAWNRLGATARPWPLA